MNFAEKRRFEKYVNDNRIAMLKLLRTGVGRPDCWKESNYRDMQDYLRDIRILGAREDSIAEAAEIFARITNRTLEVAAPPNDNGAARKLAEVIRDSSPVQRVIEGIDIRLDNDQNKHQHPTKPIGNRQKGGGNRFKAQCDAAWHIANTMVHMARWANDLGAMRVGDKQYHGQAVAVNNIHYEGFCLYANDTKYVLFHCYPSDSNALKL